MAAGNYLRDGRAPIPSDERTSALMSRIRAKDTAPELIIRALLRAAGLTGYRLHYAKAPGKPDIAFVGRKLAVFVHGCFWHGCPHCQPPRPKRNTWYWGPKLDANMARDARKARALRRAGWIVVTLWECRIKRWPDTQAARVLRAFDRRTTSGRSVARSPRRIGTDRKRRRR